MNIGLKFGRIIDIVYRASIVIAVIVWIAVFIVIAIKF